LSRAVIKFFVKQGLAPNEIHSKFIRVYGDSSPSFSRIKEWAAEFKRGRIYCIFLLYYFLNTILSRTLTICRTSATNMVIALQCFTLTVRHFHSISSRTQVYFDVWHY